MTASVTDCPAAPISGQAQARKVPPATTRTAPPVMPPGDTGTTRGSPPVPPARPPPSGSPPAPLSRRPFSSQRRRARRTGCETPGHECPPESGLADPPILPLQGLTHGCPWQEVRGLRFRPSPGPQAAWQPPATSVASPCRQSMRTARLTAKEPIHVGQEGEEEDR